jgi:hypothetical protein
MTKKNKKRPSGYRERNGSNPSKASSNQSKARGSAPAARTGVLASLLSPRPRDSRMPKKSTSFGRGVITAAYSPVIVGATMAAVIGGWLIFVALGFQGPFSIMSSFLSIPPIGVAFDTSLAARVPGISLALLLLGLLVLGGILLAIMSSLVYDAITGVPADRWTFVRAARIIPVTLAMNMFSLAIAYLSQFFGILGSGIGSLAGISALIAGVHFFAFAPVIALSEERGMAESITKSFRAARMQGSTNLTFAAVYGVGMVAILFGSSAGKLGVNPTPQGWAAVLFVNFIQVGVMAAFAYRYLSVAEYVPEPPTPAPRRSRG